MNKHKDSHLDHGLTEAQIAFILAQPIVGGVHTIELPEELGTVPCGLYGPVVGDPPVSDTEVTYAARGQRKLVDRPARPARLVTVVVGPHDGGPQAPREPFEFEPRDDFKSLDHIASEAFWKEHALAR